MHTTHDPVIVTKSWIFRNMTLYLSNYNPMHMMIDPHDICQIKYPLMNVTVRNNVMAYMN